MQAGSLYKLRALGRAEHMEVSAEGLRVKTYADLVFLTPFFILLYIFQSYNGYTLWHLAPKARDDERFVNSDINTDICDIDTYICVTPCDIF